MKMIVIKKNKMIIHAKYYDTLMSIVHNISTIYVYT